MAVEQDIAVELEGRARQIAGVDVEAVAVAKDAECRGGFTGRKAEGLGGAVGVIKMEKFETGRPQIRRLFFTRVVWTA